MQDKDKMKKYMQKNAGSCSGQNNSGQTFIDDKKGCLQWLFFQVFLSFKMKGFFLFSVPFSLPLWHWWENNWIRVVEGLGMTIAAID